MIVPIELRLRAKVLGLRIHPDAIGGGWVLVKRVNSNLVAASKRNATLREIAEELTRREAA